MKRPGDGLLVAPGFWAATADGITGLLSALTKLLLFLKTDGEEVNGLAAVGTGNWSPDETGI